MKKVECEISVVNSDDDFIRISKLERVCFSDAWSLTSFLNEKKNPDSVTLAAKRKYSEYKNDGLPIAGYANIHFVYGDAYINKLAVASECRKQGIGTALLEKTIETAKEKGCGVIVLDVRKSNYNARKFYLKHGFTEKGKRKNLYQNPVEEGIVMAYCSGSGETAN
ncbi:MAG: ribosomal protein S18-alanine N-acetyltransferase [Oscillospiraceae bacterium]|nr:ribosomal protein S18-alanine N-acetyltransferase [Oscillospiraceae bacterium]